MATEFIKTPIFTKVANRILSQAERESVTEMLARDLDAGDTIPGSGGLRKLRIPGSSPGKRGGLRVIYAVRRQREQTFLIFLFAKNDRSNLTPAEYRELGKLMR